MATKTAVRSITNTACGDVVKLAKSVRGELARTTGSQRTVLLTVRPGSFESLLREACGSDVLRKPSGHRQNIIAQEFRNALRGRNVTVSQAQPSMAGM